MTLGESSHRRVDPGRLTLSDYSARCLALEQALRAEGAVADVVVRPRIGVDGVLRLVAYAVPVGMGIGGALPERAVGDSGSPSIEMCVVWICAIPLDARGGVDEAALARLPVLDDSVARRCEEVLRSIPGVAAAAAKIQDHQRHAALLPLDELLPREGARPETAHCAVLPAPVREANTAPDKARVQYSISDGGEIFDDPDRPSTLPGVLLRAATYAARQCVVHVQSDGTELEQSYTQLLDDARRVVGGLRALGLEPGARLILQLGSSEDFLVGFWACQLGGFVPVPMAAVRQLDSEGADAQRLVAAWRLLAHPTILADALCTEMFAADRAELGHGQMNIASIVDMRGYLPDLRVEKSGADEVALMLLTSGSTGVPKAVCQSHRALLSRSAAWASANGDSVDDVTFNWMPLDHVGGIVMWHLRDVFLGCRQIHASSEYILRDPLRWLDAVDRHRVTNTWAPNFAYALIVDQVEKVRAGKWDLSCVRYFLNGGESIVARNARQFLRVLEPHRLKATSMLPAWGMSETCSGVTFDDEFRLDSSSDDDRYVCVGRPIPGTAIRIVDTEDKVVPQGTVGRLQVKGTTVTSGYFNAPETTRDSFTADGWFITGDLASMRDGRVTITGREKDVIIINGINYGCHQVEAAVEEVDGVDVSNTAACAVRSRVTGKEGFAVFFTTLRETDAELKPLLVDIRKRVLERVGIVPDYLLPVRPAAIPKTSIGKIQRVQLRDRFEAGEFDLLARRVRRLVAGTNEIRDWFYRSVWRPARFRATDLPTNKQARTDSASTEKGVTLVFSDATGVASAAIGTLRSRGASVIVVESSEEFVRNGPEAFAIDPRKAAHYVQLLRDIQVAHGPVVRVMHCLACDADSVEPSHVGALALGRRYFYSILFLIQALVEARGDTSQVDLLVVSSGAQMVGNDDELAYGNASLSGLLRTVPHELPWMRCRHVDLAPGETSVGEVLADEFDTRSNEPEVAYRRGERLVLCVENANLAARDFVRSPVRKGGLYLITGGLGAVGTTVARYLMERFDARLILVGRRERPDTSAAGQRPDGSVITAQRRIDNYRLLQSAGGDFVYESADVSDFETLQDIVGRAEKRWGRSLDGIFHLASVGVWSEIQRHRIANEQPDAFERMFRAKVDGTWCLAKLQEDRPDAALVVFSSVYGVFGAPTYGAYAAANAFIEPFVRILRRRGRQAYCFHWSVWESPDMTADGRAAAHGTAASLGYGVVSPELGLASMLAGIARDEPALIVGADVATPAVRARMRAGADPCEVITSFYTVGDAARPIDVTKLRVCDVFDTPIALDPARVERIPMTSDGVVDWPLLLRTEHRSSRRKEQTRSRTPVESRIAEIWGEVLDAHAIGMDDNFFAMGGDSIRAAVVVNRIQALFGIAMPMITLFKNPTVAELAVHVEAQCASATAPMSGREVGADLLNVGPARHGTTTTSESGSARVLLDRRQDGDTIPVHRSEEEALLSKLDELSEEELELLIAKHSKRSGVRNE